MRSYKLLVFCTALLLLTTACASTPEGRRLQTLGAAYSTYATVGHDLLEARESGRIDDSTWRRVQATDRVAWAALEGWYEGERAGRVPADAARRFEAAVDDLVILLLEAQADE